MPITTTKTKVAKSLNNAIGELAEIQRMLEDKPAPMICEDMTVCAENAIEECEDIIKALKNTVILK